MRTEIGMARTEFCNRVMAEASGGQRAVTSSSTRPAGVLDADFLATLVAIAGHDLRQPLQCIRSAHNVRAPLLHTEEQWRQLSAAEAAIGQLVSMLDQLVDTVQLHECSRQVLRVPTPVSPLLDRLAQELNRSARRKGIVFRIGEARTSVLSHPVLLTSVMRNLVRNAIDYTPCGGFVSVTCEEHGRELHIHVCDSGPGIDADALAIVFKAFQRLDPEQGDGLGLGLFIVRRVAELLGHRIDVRSAEGCGSRFTIVTRSASSRRCRTSVDPLDPSPCRKSSTLQVAARPKVASETGSPRK
jgi:two-component system phosphate regulon sensor histidine kinase PhoR